MGLGGLLASGGPERGYLEKFADGCNFLARVLWKGTRHVEILESETGYTVQAKGRGSVTSGLIGLLSGRNEEAGMAAPMLCIGYILFTKCSKMRCYVKSRTNEY